MSRVNQIVFTEDEFGTGLFDAVGRQLELLLLSNHICVVKEDECGIVVIEFEHDERREAFDVPNPVWLTEEEILDVKFNNET